MRRRMFSGPLFWFDLAIVVVYLAICAAVITLKP